MISAIVLTKNEQHNIKECLGSLSFCDEIVIIDDLSLDKTREIAKKMRAKVFIHSLNDDFSAQRNFGLEKAKGDWILFVDADERVPEALASEISNFKFQISNYTGFYLRRVDVMWGRELKYGETGDIKLLRLAKRGAGSWEGKVHERWEVKGRVSQLQNPLLHYPHQTVAEFLQEINFYTSLRAKELYEKGIGVHWWSIIAYPKGKFLVNYFLRRGFLDGLPGFVFAILMSLHSFLVRAKLWLLWQKK